MVVNFEFLGTEPIENVITCLHYKVDKVIFFGYHEVIQQQKEYTKDFLEKYCGVKKVVFRPLEHNNLPAITKTMRTEIESEISKGSQIYFDVTGGESLILVAFGMLSQEYNTSMHLYDIWNDRLIELDEGSASDISEDVPSHSVPLTLDMYIEMKGSVINHKLQKTIKGGYDAEFEEDILRIWDVANRYAAYWNPFSNFLKKITVNDANLQVHKSAGEIIQILRDSNSILDTPKELNAILDALGDTGVIRDVAHANGKYCFTMKSQTIKECLRDGGSILELYTYKMQKEISDDCYVGVHLDWDGVIHPKPGMDVYNEIDVLSLKGIIPTFVSCKSGNMKPQETLHALYELETVTSRFGGKYAKKILMVTQNISQGHMQRAAEMGIEIRKANA